MKSIVSIGVAAILCSSQISFASEIVKDALYFQNNTPGLGSGFSSSTRALHSGCLKFAKKDGVTANVSYSFQEVNVNTAKELRAKGDIESNFQSWFVEANAKFGSEVVEGVERTFKNILVSYAVDTYYDTVDDTDMYFSSYANDLLTNENLQGFLNGCGDHFVRSIGRHKSYFAMLSYSTESQTRDQTFESRIRSEFAAFGMGGDTEGEWSKELKQKAETNRLAMAVQAQGLKLSDISDKLLPMSLDDFRGAVKEAINTMSDENSGIITQVQIMPYTRTSAFQNAITNILGENALSGSNNFMTNSSTLARVNQALEEANYITDAYYACTRSFRNAILGVDDLESIEFVNRFNIDQPKTGKALSELLNREQLTKLRSAVNSWRYGETEDGQPLECLDKISSQDIFSKIHAPECEGAEWLPFEVEDAKAVLKQFCPLVQF